MLALGGKVPGLENEISKLQRQVALREQQVEDAKLVRSRLEAELSSVREPRVASVLGANDLVSHLCVENLCVLLLAWVMGNPQERDTVAAHEKTIRKLMQDMSEIEGRMAKIQEEIDVSIVEEVCVCVLRACFRLNGTMLEVEC